MVNVLSFHEIAVWKQLHSLRRRACITTTAIFIAGLICTTACIEVQLPWVTLPAESAAHVMLQRAIEEILSDERSCGCRCRHRRMLQL